MKTKLQFTFTISILFVLSIPLFSQNSKDEIKGHWGGCSAENGYTEMVISDSIIYRFNTSFGGLTIPTPYEFKKNHMILNNADTLFFDSPNSNLLTIHYNNSIDTLNLIDKSIPFENPNVYCDMEMTPIQYREYIDNQFLDRALRNKHKCISKKDVDSYFNATIVSSNYISDFENLDIFEGVYLENIEFEILEKNIQNYRKPVLVNFKKNEDNNFILIIVDYWGRCYEDLNVDFKIVNEDNVNLTINQTNYSCDDICKMRLYIIAREENYNLKNIKLIRGK